MHIIWESEKDLCNNHFLHSAIANDDGKHNQAVIDLLNSWEQEDEEEQRATLEFLMKALDEERSATRKLFA